MLSPCTIFAYVNFHSVVNVAFSAFYCRTPFMKTLCGGHPFMRYTLETEPYWLLLLFPRMCFLMSYSTCASQYQIYFSEIRFRAVFGSFAVHEKERSGFQEINLIYSIHSCTTVSSEVSLEITISYFDTVFITTKSRRESIKGLLNWIHGVSWNNLPSK